MAILNYLRKKFGKGEPKPKLAYVQDPAPYVPDELTPEHTKEKLIREMDKDIDLSRQTDLEGYARDISVSKESIERWISSGLLMPEELRVAEKLLHILRKR